MKGRLFAVTVTVNWAPTQVLELQQLLILSLT